MVFKIMSGVIASIALFGAVGMFASEKLGQKVSGQQAGASRDNKKFGKVEVVREFTQPLAMKDNKPIAGIDQTAIKVKVEQKVPMTRKFHSSGKTQRSKGGAVKTKTSIKTSLKNSARSEKVLNAAGVATKVRLPSITESELVRDGATRLVRDIRNTEKARKGAHGRNLERSSVRYRHVKSSKRISTSRKQGAAVTVVEQKIEKDSNKKLSTKRAKSIARIKLELAAKKRQTQLPFLSMKTKLHYQYTSRWPTTCPCELASGLLDGICWYFTGQGTSCRKRTCRRSYVCVIGAKASMTCMRKTLRERIVPNNDGTCRTEFTRGYMYKPYS